MLVKFVNKIYKKSLTVEMAYVPRVGDKINLWVNPPPTVIEVLWMFDNPDGVSVICEVD